MQNSETNGSMIVPVALSDGTTVLVEAAITDPEMEVADSLHKITDFTRTIGALAKDLVAPLANIKANEVEVAFSLGLSLETGKLTALLVGGGADTSVTITLRWKQDSPSSMGESDNE